MLKKALKQFSENRPSLVLVGIFLLAIFLRIYKLTSIPIGITHDEINYILNAKSLFYTGKNIPWTSSALFSIGEKNFDVVISEIPSILISPIVGPLPLNLFNARIIYALISSLNIIGFYVLAKNLFNSKKIGYLASILIAVNPWSIHFGRTAFEINFAFFFYTFALAFFFAKTKNHLKISFLFFLLGFMSYLGAKLMLLPIILVLVIYNSFNKISKIPNKQLIVFTGSLVLLFILYSATISLQPVGSRKNELIFFDKGNIAEIVNQQRRDAFTSSINSLFINKSLILITRIINVYIESYSTKFLFLTGETRGAYSFWQHGPFYIIDFFLITLGIYYLGKQKNNVTIFIFGILLIAPLVSAIDLVEQSYVMRSFPLFWGLPLLTTLGICQLYKFLKSRKFLSLLFGFIYLIFVLNFLHLYFYRYQIYASDGWFFSEKILAEYVRREKDNNLIYIYTTEPKIVFESYLFYTNSYNSKQNIKEINKQMETKNFSWEGVVFTNECNQDSKSNFTILIDKKMNCLQKKKADSQILSLSDAGFMYNIYNDNLCSHTNLSQYYLPKEQKDLFFEKLNNISFCQKWIAKQN